MNGGVNAGKMWLDCLADYFENKHLERTVTFAPVIRRQPFDHNHADNMYYEKFPDEMKAWKASGAKLMAYLQPMIMWTPDARTDREKDALRFHELATPLGAFGGSGDHHLGEPHWQRWFLDWVQAVHRRRRGRRGVPRRDVQLPHRRPRPGGQRDDLPTGHGRLFPQGPDGESQLHPRHRAPDGGQRGGASFGIGSGMRPGDRRECRAP